MNDRIDTRTEQEKIAEHMQPINRLTKDLRIASRSLSEREARYLVDSYYLLQRDRIAADNQIRSMSADGEPTQLLVWLADQMRTLEGQVKITLDAYSMSHPVGEWARGILGVGPVICAGLLAHIDIKKAPTAGHIWNFAGLNPGVEWGKGQKRPWNGNLKTLCWKLGESFVKVSGNDKSFYGKLFRERKVDEIRRNRAGEFIDQAKRELERKKIDKSKVAYAFYAGCLPPETTDGWSELSQAQHSARVKKLRKDPGTFPGMLPPGHIHARAKRWTVKIFLSHLHAKWYEIVFDEEAPVPYAIAHLGHAHLIAPPETG